MSKSRLVKTTFQSGPDDSLAAIDVYKKDTSEVVNSYDQTEPQAIDVLDSLNGKADESSSAPNSDNPDGSSDEGGAGSDGGASGSDFDTSNINGLDDPFSSMDPDTSAREIGEEELFDRLSDGDEVLGQCLRDMDPSVISQLQLPNKKNSKIEGVFAGIKSSIPDKIPLPSVRSMATMVDNLSKGNYPSVIQDVGAKSGLIGSLVNMASALKLPSAFSKIAQHSGISPNILVDAARIGITSSLARGDIGVFKDVAKTSVASNMRYVIPNLTNKAIRAIDKPKEIDYRNYSSYYNENRAALSTMDPSWNTYNRANSSAMNGSVIGENPFFMDTMRASVTSKPLTINIPRAGTAGNLIDVEYADISNPEIFKAIYGDEVTLTDRTAIVREWKNNTQEKEAREARQNDAYLLLMQEYDTTPVVDSLKADFPLLEISDTNQIDSFSYTA